MKVIFQKQEEVKKMNKKPRRKSEAYLLGGAMCRVSRERANLTLEEAGERLNVVSRMVSYYESGTYAVPEEMLMKMKDVYEDPRLPWNYWSSCSPIAQHYKVQLSENLGVSAMSIKEKTAFVEAA
jgi:transcriptional regulator with XRE-family HTH domain